MTEKERKHQYYLRHKAETIERARRWREQHPERSKEVQAQASQKWRSKHRDYINAHSREAYQMRISSETPEESEVRRAKERDRSALRRRKAGIPERRSSCLSDEERHLLEAKRQRDRYHDPDKHERLKLYERKRKRAWRERKKQEVINRK